jgi:hypothetical protein
MMHVFKSLQKSIQKKKTCFIKHVVFSCNMFSSRSKIISLDSHVLCMPWNGSYIALPCICKSLCLLSELPHLSTNFSSFFFQNFMSAFPKHPTSKLQKHGLFLWNNHAQSKIFCTRQISRFNYHHPHMHAFVCTTNISYAHICVHSEHASKHACAHRFSHAYQTIYAHIDFYMHTNTCVYQRWKYMESIFRDHD